jgi:hypothetical protein
MPGPYYANKTQKKKAVLLSYPLGNRLVLTHRGECWQVRIIALHLCPHTLCAPALAKSRDTVAGCTLKSLAASAAVLVPVDTIVTISSC